MLSREQWLKLLQALHEEGLIGLHDWVVDEEGLEVGVLTVGNPAIKIQDDDGRWIDESTAITADELADCDKTGCRALATQLLTLAANTLGNISNE